MKQIAFLTPGDFAITGWDGWTDTAIRKAFAGAGVPLVVSQPSMVFIYAGKALRRIGAVRNLHSRKDRAYLITLPHLSEYKLFPATYFAEIIPFIYDCWPTRWNQWEAFFPRHDIRLAFFSARQARDHFAARFPEIECIWMPEACDPTAYDASKSLRERSIDVDEFGRRHDAYHAQILQPLANNGLHHKFAWGRSRAEFLADLGNCRISICFPRSITEPQRAQGVQTLTLRYLECMASRCVIVGHCPQELRDVFGYDPVVAADMERSAEQLMSILNDIESYQPLVDRNREQVERVGTWGQRVKSMLQILASRGYGVPASAETAG